MSKFWKRSAAVLLAGVLTASLAACGSTSTGSTGNSDNANSSTEDKSAGNTGSTENTGDIVKLVVWGVALPIQKIVKKLPLPSAKSPGRKSGLKSNWFAVRMQNRSIWRSPPASLSTF